MTNLSSYGLVAFISVFVALLYTWWSHRDAHRERLLTREVEDLGELTTLVPPTLHPIIDPLRCIGSGACVKACPEDVLGVIQGRAQLLNPLGCIGHGACAAACPAEAIQLVFGTRTRGVELPRVDKHFQTNQPGIYVVGELGGMGLIRNAVLQGSQAADHIVRGQDEKAPRRAKNGGYDALVVGAGPAGIATTLRLLEARLKVLLVDQDEFGGTIMHYPRAKVVMTGDLPIPLLGTVKRRTMSRERLLDMWADLRARFDIPFKSHEVVRSVTAAPDGSWLVRSDNAAWSSANVVLALGTRGSPRRLGVPGEELAKVHYRLLEPQEFANKHVLVVGGGNSAVETALSLADFGRCASVGLSYRREQFVRCRSENRRRIAEAIGAGKVQSLMPTEVVHIDRRSVVLKHGDRQRAIANDAVIAQLGGTAPSDVLKSFGIALTTKFGEA
jgi:thioredoxin reductase/NAD-dependent dihydropyrimidine dehydrogenase PreA subunit